MALKYVVDKIDDVPESLRGEYTEKDGKWHLSVDGLEDTTGLKKQRDELLNEKKEAQRKAKEAEEAAKLAAEEAARKNGDMQNLEKSITERYEGKVNELTTQLKQRDGMILGGKKETIVSELSQIAISPLAMRSLFNDLVDVSYGENNAITIRYLHPQTRQVLTTDKDEFLRVVKGIDELKPLIKASAASGGGASGGGNNNQKTISREQFDKMPQSDRQAFFKGGGKVV